MVLKWATRLIPQGFRQAMLSALVRLATGTRRFSTRKAKLVSEIPPMIAQDRQYITDICMEDIEALEAYTGMDLSSWKQA